jgi:hypothetical protein
VAVVGYCRVEAGCVVVERGYDRSCGGFDEEARLLRVRWGDRYRSWMEKTTSRRWWVLRPFRMYLRENNKNPFTYSP